MVRHSQKRKIGPVFFSVFLIYSAYLLYLTLFSHFYGRSHFHRSINLVPFRTIVHFLLNAGSAGALITNLFGNIAAFLPMGFLPPFFSDKFRKPRNIVLLILTASCLIEILQFCTGTGVSDVDDILLNTIGGVLGYLPYFFYERGVNEYVKRKDS
ncbi:MAG TPA: VanZ family protein [Ruminiclostridium sp.]|nr:VanZ family protein [Ruminiclostridium sp.]